MTYWLREVTDEHGTVLELGRRLGKGGQGEVRRVVNHPGLAVKLVTGRPARGFDDVRRLPLSNVAIAAPTALLQQRDGYVMRLADDMASLTTLVPPEFGTKHDLEWYSTGGGLRRRLRVAAKASAILARLHGLALVYVDLNPGNVMVSERPDHDEVMLIDADNLDLVSDVMSGLGTPRFFAPERWRGISGPTTLSDAYSLAVLIFALLTMKYPFDGHRTDQLEGDEAIEATDRGELPFVDHPDDDSNRALGGVPRRYVLSPVLRSLAQRSFVEGVRQPASRPSVAEWRDALWRAESHVIDCLGPRCRWSFYRDLDACPLCGTHRPDLVGVAVRRNEDAEKPFSTCVLQPERALRLHEHQLWGDDTSGESPMTLVSDEKGVNIRWAAGSDVEVLYPKRNRKAQGRSTTVSLKPGSAARLRLTTAGKPARIVDLGWIER